MAGELITADYQFEYRGLLMGPGTNYRMRKIEGLTELAPVRSSDVAYGVADGEIPRGYDWLSGRDVTFDMEVHANTDAGYQSALAALGVALAPAGDADDVDPLVFRLPGRDQARLLCAPRRQTAPIDQTWALGRMANMLVQFHAHDPLIYSDTEYTLDTGRELPGSGFTPPVVPPFTLGPSTGGTFNAANAGGAAVKWRGRLTGPLTYPVIEHEETGKQLSLALTANGGIDLAAGQYIDIDSAAGSMLLNGTADIRQNLAVGYSFWRLGRGPNTIKLTADSGTGRFRMWWRLGSYS